MKFGKTIAGACKLYTDAGSPLRIDAHNVTFASDVLILDNRRYIKMHVTDSLLEFIQDLESKCADHNTAYASSLHDNTILVKLPFRYNRYMISYTDATSQLLAHGKTAACVTVELCGLVTLQSGRITCSYKMIALRG